MSNSSLYQLYKTDPAVEKQGKELLFADGQLRLTLARAGGANTKFEKILAANAKPYKRAIQADLLSTEKSNQLLMATYAEAIVTKCETLVETDGQESYAVGVPLEDMEGLQPVNVENLTKLFKALPDLFKDVVDEANKLANYRSYVTEEDAKN